MEMEVAVVLMSAFVLAFTTLGFALGYMMGVMSEMDKKRQTIEYIKQLTLNR